MASEKQCVNPSVHPQPCQVCGPVGGGDKVNEAVKSAVLKLYRAILAKSVEQTDAAVLNLIAAVRAEQPACYRCKSTDRSLDADFHCSMCYRNLEERARRAEQPQVGLYRNKLLKGLHGILTDANHPTPEDIDDIDGILTAVRIAVGPWPEAQPPAIGHVANCRCHNPISTEHSCEVCYEPISANVPDYTDPRCDEARAEVERLREQS